MSGSRVANWARPCERAETGPGRPRACKNRLEGTRSWACAIVEGTSSPSVATMYVARAGRGRSPGPTAPHPVGAIGGGPWAHGRNSLYRFGRAKSHIPFGGFADPAIPTAVRLTGSGRNPHARRSTRAKTTPRRRNGPRSSTGESSATRCNGPRRRARPRHGPKHRGRKASVTDFEGCVRMASVDEQAQPRARWSAAVGSRVTVEPHPVVPPSPADLVHHRGRRDGDALQKTAA